MAVNRLWQWHFGEGLHRSPSDFGKLGGTPADQSLLDWLASEFVARGFRMKAIHRLIVTSEAYKRASEAAPAIANAAADPTDAHLWRFPLRRLEAEPIRTRFWTAARQPSTRRVGGPLVRSLRRPSGRMRADRAEPAAEGQAARRAAYMIRGFSTSRDVVPVFLQAFDVDDGRVPCPVRTRTVTPPQALFLMNGEAIEKATEKFAERLKTESAGDLGVAVDLAYRVARWPRPNLFVRSERDTFHRLSPRPDDPDSGDEMRAAPHEKLSRHGCSTSTRFGVRNSLRSVIPRHW